MSYVPAPPRAVVPATLGGVDSAWPRRARVGAKLAGSTYLWTLLWLIAWVIVPTLFGWTPLAIQTGSMVPALEVGDVILIGDVEPRHLVPDTIITFADPTRGGALVTHRIVDVNPDGTLVTQGDANRDPDSAPVGRNAIEGMGRAVVPIIGLPLAWANTDQHRRLLAAVLVTVAAALAAGSRLPTPTPSHRSFGSPARVAAVRPPDRDWPHDLPFAPRRGNGVRLRSGLTLLLTIAVLLASSVSLLTFGTTRSAFFGSEASVSSFVMAAVAAGTYVDEVTADSPIAWWRLDDVGTTTTTPDQVIQSTSLESQDWINTGAGITRVPTPVHSGTFAGSSTAAGNGLSGGYWSYPNVTGTRWRLTSHHSLGTGGRASVFVSNNSVSGYGAAISENDVLEILRYDAEVPTVIASQALANTPPNRWIRVQLDRDGSTFTATAEFADDGQLLGTVTTTDGTYSGARYLDVNQLANTGVVDDIAFVIPGTTTTTPATAAVDTTGNEPDAPLAGGVTTGQPGLVNDGASFAFDGIDDVVEVPDSDAINTDGPYAARSVELWFSADNVTSSTPQVLYEEGGNSGGLSIWIGGSTLYVEAWSNRWSNTLLASTGVQAGTTYQVVMVLDAAGDSLTGYLDGTAFGSSTKTDGRALPGHSANIGIGAMNQATHTNNSNNGGDGLYFAGRIDEVSLYDTALPAARVAAHFIAGDSS